MDRETKEQGGMEEGTKETKETKEKGGMEDGGMEEGEGFFSFSPFTIHHSLFSPSSLFSPFSPFSLLTSHFSPFHLSPFTFHLPHAEFLPALMIPKEQRITSFS
jgi:hypothetical protein